MLPLFYNDVYQVQLPAGHRFPMEKYRLVREVRGLAILYCPVLLHLRFLQVCLCHPGASTPTISLLFAALGILSGGEVITAVFRAVNWFLSRQLHL